MKRRGFLKALGCTVPATAIPATWGYTPEPAKNASPFIEYHCLDGGKMVICETTAGVEICKYPAEHSCQEWRVYVSESGVIHELPAMSFPLT